MEERRIEFYVNIKSNVKCNWTKCPSRAEQIKIIKEIGKDARHDLIVYGMRWKVESSFSNFKKLFKECLSAKNMKCMLKELAVKIEIYDAYKEMCFF